MSENRKMHHIGFIMDGNRRYAKRLQNVVSFWHERGGDNIENILWFCLDAEISHVSMWALSKENIQERDSTEINAIYSLIEKKVPKLIPKLIQKWIRFEVIWDLWLIPDTIRTILFDAMEQTTLWTNMTFILAIGYSGQDEIVRGIKRIIAEWVDPKMLTEKEFLTYLDSGKYPPPDLIVRTGGNIRHSGFFLYQSAYSEYYFTETLWPEFSQWDFQKALDFFYGVKRNFWK